MKKNNATILLSPTGDLLEDILRYCELFAIPPNHFLEIITDQKVAPMIRGKGTEFAVYDFLLKILPNHIWETKKLNINAQPGCPDEDVSVYHIESGQRIDIEVKNAKRNSFHMGNSRTSVKEPHFRVKCHRSRSNMDKVINDRYIPQDFDLVISNPSNSLILSGEEYNIINEPKAIEFLFKFYNTTNYLELFSKASRDWRFARPENIIENYKRHEVVPRTPTVRFSNDPNWHTIENIERVFLDIIRCKLNSIN